MKVRLLWDTCTLTASILDVHKCDLGPLWTSSKKPRGFLHNILTGDALEQRINILNKSVNASIHILIMRKRYSTN